MHVSTISLFHHLTAYAGVQAEYKTLGLRQGNALKNFSQEVVYHAFCELVHSGLVTVVSSAERGSRARADAASASKR